MIHLSRRVASRRVATRQLNPPWNFVKCENGCTPWENFVARKWILCSRISIFRARHSPCSYSSSFFPYTFSLPKYLRHKSSKFSLRLAYFILIKDPFSKLFIVPCRNPYVYFETRIYMYHGHPVEFPDDPGSSWHECGRETREKRNEAAMTSQ